MVKHQPSEVRRAQILQAAIEVCSEKGYHATRIDDIAAQAGLSKGAVYHHFTSKQDVFLSVIARILDEVAQLIETLEAGGTSTAETIRQTIRYAVELIEQSPKLMRGFIDLYLLGLRDSEFRDRFKEYYSRLLGACEKVFRHGIERGEVAADIDPAKLARVLCLGGDGIMLMHFVLGEYELGCQSMMDLTELLLRAIEKR